MKSSASEPSLSGSFLSITVNNSTIPLPMQDGLIYFRQVCSGGLNEEEGLFEKKEKNGYLAKLGARLQTSRYHFFPQIKGK